LLVAFFSSFARQSVQRMQINFSPGEVKLLRATSNQPELSLKLCLMLMLVLLLLLLLFVLIELLFVLSRRCGFYYCSFAVNKNNGNILMKIAA